MGLKVLTPVTMGRIAANVPILLLLAQSSALDLIEETSSKHGGSICNVPQASTIDASSFIQTSLHFSDHEEDPPLWADALKPAIAHAKAEVKEEIKAEAMAEAKEEALMEAMTEIKAEIMK